MNATSAIAAGAAAAAARDTGANEQQQLQQGTLAAIAVANQERAREEADVLEGSGQQAKKTPEGEEKQPGEGWMRKLMHALNIR